MVPEPVPYPHAPGVQCKTRGRDAETGRGPRAFPQAQGRSFWQELPAVSSGWGFWPNILDGVSLAWNRCSGPVLLAMGRIRDAKQGHKVWPSDQGEGLVCGAVAQEYGAGIDHVSVAYSTGPCLLTEARGRRVRQQYRD